VIGIVFTGGEGPEPQTFKKLLDERAGGELLIVAADSGLALAEASGIIPDWVVGDMDSIDSEKQLSHYPKERVIYYPVDKDYTDTEIALTLLWEKGCEDAWIVGGGGGRLDHIFGIRDLFERDPYPCRWITANEDIRCIDGADKKNNSLNLGVGQGKLVSIFPLGDGPWEASSSGLKWELGNAHWKRGLFGLSNVALLNEEIEINVKRGRFMIILEK